MNSRERVLAAVEHRQPDRVPRNFWAEPATWNRLQAFTGHRNKEELLCSLNIDIRALEAPTPPEKEIGGGVFQNFWGERYIYRPTDWGIMREDIPGALNDAKCLADLEAFPWHTPDEVDYSSLAEQCERWDDKALLYGFADVWQRPCLVRGMQNMFFDMADRPENAHFLSRKFTDFYKEDYCRAAAAAKGRIDMFLLISDLGSQTNTLISPKMFREFVAPYIKEMCDCIHSLGAKVLFHSCGNIFSLIGNLIELGVDILDPVQPVGNMSPEKLKETFGRDICFHGGIDMQDVLPKGTPEEVRRVSRKYQEVLGKEGGYILAPAHLFQPDVPPENILAVYDEV
ncbi:uroporphyrinogen decarboxylase [Planctomycetales bacterium]|nr:uroporphyrinogen decarboxylase [Planctomycetales bacterium]GHT34919.1 uroporphyrinogen decarboxylase [Planctomycetales bacterium]